MNNKPPTSMKEVLIRARIIFSTLLILTFLSSSSSFYLGYKSGEVERSLVSPMRQKYLNFITGLQKALEEPKVATPPALFDLSVPATPTVTPVIIKTQTDIPQINIPQPTIYYKNNNSDDWWVQTQKETQDWWNKVIEEDRQKSEQSRQEVEDFGKQSQQRMEELQKQAEQGRIDFENRMKAEQEQFRKDNGF